MSRYSRHVRQQTTTHQKAGEALKLVMLYGNGNEASRKKAMRQPRVLSRRQVKRVLRDLRCALGGAQQTRSIALRWDDEIFLLLRQHEIRQGGRHATR